MFPLRCLLPDKSAVLILGKVLSAAFRCRCHRYRRHHPSDLLWLLVVSCRRYSSLYFSALLQEKKQVMEKQADIEEERWLATVSR